MGVHQNHEIRTPLVGVVSMAELLRTRSDLPADLAEHLQVIHDSGRALLSIVNSILDISQLRAQRAVAQRTVCPPARAMRCRSRLLARCRPQCQPRILTPAVFSFFFLGEAPQRVNIRHVLTNTANMFGALATTKGLAYSVVFDPVLPARIVTDETRIQQILGNLLGATGTPFVAPWTLRAVRH